MNNQCPTPQVPAAYQALYGNPDEKLNTLILNAFRQLSDANQVRALTFVEALINDDQATVSRMKREAETDIAYLQHNNMGGVL